ncbi:MAG: NAD(P)-dependent alcohol dehydrogenase [Deltaproteobacteria bacterium]|nr:NAD(P)-dependent alcohol dehydrogenase [Deltaproteobacteria bacterium]MBW2050326.1 NAD(P)-dependent alcohol dehydrogenase [Deltaproteobacteria bacterium]MBW2112851.1 NAD(P)-dependent alcohol dehydrogenase [Deltaproteobacteria bacterium]MBW2353609.1 NAD(P)-dependent alcohol dehydrogenase [Deltaproteobacteria bacterium]HDZ89316.1 NAD(P)-dependent alcohol dehydrogenase [Deltaproteobacteria bacterium]
MKAALLHSFDEFLTGVEWLTHEDVPEPVIEGENEVIVRIGGAGVCRTDLDIIRGLWRKYFNIRLPHILGHENAGWVEEVGGRVKNIAVGDPVIIHPRTFNSRCDTCGERMPKTTNLLFPGMSSNGGFAEFMKVDERSLIRLPASLAPMDAAPLADAGLTAYNAAKRASRHLVPGDFVVVIGAGGLGHVGIQALQVLSTSEIIAIDISGTALNLAREMGAHYTVRADEYHVERVLALTGGKGARAVIDFVGDEDTVKQGFTMTRRSGFYYVAGSGGTLEISTTDMIMSEKTVEGILSGSYSELFELIVLADRGLIKVTTQEYPLRNVNDALRDLRDGKIEGRAVLIP